MLHEIAERDFYCAPCRFTRTEGQQGLAVQSSSYNQCARWPSSMQTCRPIVPARCAPALSVI
jgi:hypothetical protein